MTQYTHENAALDSYADTGGIGCGGILIAMIAAVFSASAFSYYKLSERRSQEIEKRQSAQKEALKSEEARKKSKATENKNVSAKLAELIQMLQSPDKTTRKKALKIIQEQRITGILPTLEQRIYQEEDFELAQEMEKVVKELEKMVLEKSGKKK